MKTSATTTSRSRNANDSSDDRAGGEFPEGVLAALQALLAAPIRINAPDSHFDAERISAIDAIGDGTHELPSDADSSMLSLIGALAQLALASFGLNSGHGSHARRACVGRAIKGSMKAIWCIMVTVQVL